MKIYVAHAKNFEYLEKLYEPLRHSELNNGHEFIFPLEHEKEDLSKDVIRSCDLLLAEVSKPSTGAGIEMGWANAFDISILCIHETGARVSSALELVTNNHIEYSDPNDLIEKLMSYLKATGQA